MRALFRWMLGAVLWLCITPFGWAQGLITHVDAGTDRVVANEWVTRMVTLFGQPDGGTAYEDPETAWLPDGCPGVGAFLEFRFTFTITCDPTLNRTLYHMKASGREIVDCTYPYKARVFDVDWWWYSPYDFGVDYIRTLLGQGVPALYTTVTDPPGGTGSPDEPGGGAGGPDDDDDGAGSTDGTLENPYFFMSVRANDPEGLWWIGFRIEGVTYFGLVHALPPELKAKAEAWAGARCEFYGH